MASACVNKCSSLGKNISDKDTWAACAFAKHLSLIFLFPICLFIELYFYVL